MNATSDVIIIGGGINGVSIAYNLAKQGASVTLLEKGAIASGPTGHSSSIVRQHYSNEVTARMALRSLQIWQNFEELTGAKDVFRETGFIIGVQPDDLEGLKANIAMQQSLGINTRLVTPEEMQELEPQVNPEGLGGGAYEPESGYCDPDAAANGFAKAAKQLGANILTDVAVSEIVVEDGQVRGVESSAGFFPASKVVVAAGPWSPILLGKLGVELPFITARIKIGLFQWPDEFKQSLVWADFVTQTYLRPEAGGLMLVGSIDPAEMEDQVSDPDSYNQRVEIDLLAEFGEKAASRYPAMEESHLASNYASLYDITPDWHPILDAVPGSEGLYLCAGTSGHGFKLAPAVGEMMAQLVLHGKGAEDDINLFAFDRFEAGKPVRGQYEYSILG